MDTLVQDYRTGAMAESGLSQRFKKMVYQYDLISGKVNHVAYQANKADQFYHRYAYDAENRITQAQTSADSIVWEREALYSYYLHGPLSRVQLGQYKVQGQDYAYTLQGWLKAINGMPNRGNELGNDGGVTFANQYTGIDAYSIQLHYNTNDYTAILSNCNCVANTLTLPATHHIRNLYNGNIAGMSVSIPTLNNYPLTNPTTHFGSMYYNYKYDQLNRLKQMDTYTRMLVSSSSIIYSTALSDYKERIKYDANGNILKYQRHGAVKSSLTGASTGPLRMDSLEYKYYAGTNRLRQVLDDTSYTENYTEDIDNQSDTSNYLYDAIGNLIKDKHEGIDSIYWNVYGKIMDISKSNGDSIHYTYDAGGNRISKTVLSPTGGVGGGPDTTTTWYARDATGNVMSVYRIRKDTVYQDELHLYGSSRIGILRPERVLNLATQYGDTSVSVSILGTAKGNVFRRGMKFFELANHLGNVLVTISDKKNGYDAAGDGNVDYYKPVVMSANDYYPFGMVMPGRRYSINSEYRYGFNGKENDNEVKGKSNQQDYGMRIYDPRLGRFLSVDPLTRDYPWYTPYQFAGNDVIRNSDVDGAEPDLQTMASAQKKQAVIQLEVAEKKKLYPHGFFSVHKPTLGEKLFNYFNDPHNEVQFNTSPAGAAAKTIFTLADDIKVLATSFATNGRDSRHIGGKKANFDERLGSFTNVSSTILGSAISAETKLAKAGTPVQSKSTLYRGVNDTHVNFVEAKAGNVKPNGGTATALEHNSGNTLNSPFSAWTTNPEVATNYALRPSGSGVVLKAEIPLFQQVRSPNLKQVNLAQSPGTVVSESEVLVTGQVKGAKVTEIKNR